MDTIDGSGNTQWLKYDDDSGSISEINDWKDNYNASLEKNLIRIDSNGITSVGENSLKLQETATEQKLWGTNSSGQIVPINITNGSKLLINGRDVEQSIDNVGALSAALTAFQMSQLIHQLLVVSEQELIVGIMLFQEDVLQK